MSELTNIRRFQVDVLAYVPEEYTCNLELRVLEPHRRHILLENGRAHCVAFPHTLCWSKTVWSREGKSNPDEHFIGMGFLKGPIGLADLTLDMPIWIPPLPHFSSFTPTCHPYSDVGRDAFESDFNGFFGSPFASAYDSPNREASNLSVCNFRNWAKMTPEQVANSLVKSNTLKGFFGGIFRYCQKHNPPRFSELPAIPGRMAL